MFRSQSLLRVIPGSDKFRLHEPLIWDADEFIVIPAGFLTDLASVPRIAQPIVPKTGPYADASVLHDYLFVIQDRPFTAVNALFLEAMKTCGVRRTRRWLIWAAVATGGWLSWQRNARELADHPRRFLRQYGLERR